MDECNPAIYRADLPQPSMELPGAGGCAGYALLGVAEALDQEAKADQIGGTARASHRSADHALRSRRPGVPRRINRCRCPRMPSVVAGWACGLGAPYGLAPAARATRRTSSRQKRMFTPGAAMHKHTARPTVRRAVTENCYAANYAKSS